MAQGYIIEFDCWDDVELFEIQLEPEPITFQVTPGNTLRFLAYCETPFSWAVRMHKGGDIQLFPDTRGEYKVEIYENGTLLENWYKYM